MAQLYCSSAGLRVGGDSLLPDEITALLGAKPSKAHVKGEQTGGWTTGRPIYAKAGLWLLDACDREPENFDGQVEEILSQLTNDLHVWTEVGTRFKVDLFCGWFMEETNEGLSVSPQTLVNLGQRGIKLELNIYSPLQGETSSETANRPLHPAGSTL